MLLEPVSAWLAPAAANCNSNDTLCMYCVWLISTRVWSCLRGPPI